MNETHMVFSEGLKHENLIMLTWLVHIKPMGQSCRNETVDLDSISIDCFLHDRIIGRKLVIVIRTYSF